MDARKPELEHGRVSRTLSQNLGDNGCPRVAGRSSNARQPSRGPGESSNLQNCASLSPANSDSVDHMNKLPHTSTEIRKTRETHGGKGGFRQTQTGRTVWTLIVQITLTICATHHELKALSTPS